MTETAEKSTVRWSRSSKFIELLQPGWETDTASTTFTMLYQKAGYMAALGGNGSWTGDSGKVIAKAINLDGPE